MKRVSLVALGVAVPAWLMANVIQSQVTGAVESQVDQVELDTSGWPPDEPSCFPGDPCGLCG
jgi:hypothetical protein